MTRSRQAGYTDEELLAAGLAQRSQRPPGQLYDRFRGRIMFPTADARGRVVGFGARTMRRGPRPEVPEHRRGRAVPQARGALRDRAARAPRPRRPGAMVLVEGYTDVIALHQAGIRNAVGIMGTSLTKEQVGELVASGRGARAVPRRRPRRPGRDGPGRRGCAPIRTLELRVVPLPAGLGSRRLDRRARASTRCATGSRRRCRTCVRGRADPRARRRSPAPRDATARWGSSSRCSRRCRRVRCARTW